MADSVEFSLIGLEELNGKLAEATYDMKYKGGRYALRKAAQVVRDDARRRAQALDDPATAEDISKNIVERWSGRRFRKTGDLMFRVGVMGGARQYANTRENVRKQRAGKLYLTEGTSGNPGGDTFYWRFIEFGTEKMRAHPFMRPALSNNIGEVTDTFIRQYDKALGRALARAKKKRTTS